uniref:Antixoidant peptide n=1 Tax=Odorrana andersonii TaxID=369514 RepID=K7WPH8_ODOAN|nr:antixoidant peptide precursor [Odorrana andersonii]
MFTLKKSLLLLFFLGTISLSLCEEEKRYANGEAYEENVRDENIEKRMMLKRLGKDMAGCFKFGE